jgi:CBS domain-containing protein
MKMSKLSFAPPEHPTFILPGKLRKLPTRSIESGGKDSPLELSWTDRTGYLYDIDSRRGPIDREIPRHTVMKTKSAIDQGEEVAPRTLKEIVHVEGRTLGPEASVQEACDELRSEGMTSSPVTDKDGQLLGTVSASELNRKVGGFGHDPKIELAQTELNQETVYCFEDQTIAEAEKLMREGNLRQLPVLTREKRMVGIVTLEDIAREQRATRS